MADIEKRECSTCLTKIVYNKTNRRIDINKSAGSTMCSGCAMWMRDLRNKEKAPS